jgi:hypothetical protein
MATFRAEGNLWRAYNSYLIASKLLEGADYPSLEKRLEALMLWCILRGNMATVCQRGNMAALCHGSVVQACFPFYPLSSHPTPFLSIKIHRTLSLQVGRLRSY